MKRRNNMQASSSSRGGNTMSVNTRQAERCEACGGTLAETVLPEYHDDEQLGLPGVIIHNSVIEKRCTACGERYSITIPNLEGLVAAAAVARVKHPLKLNGQEVRFLRSAAGWSAKALARRMELRGETISRWENDKEPIGPTSEKLLRMIIGVALRRQAVGIPFDPAEVSAMEIQSVRPARARLVIHFALLRVARRKDKAWADVDEQAA